MKNSTRISVLIAFMFLVSCSQKFPLTIFTNQVHVITLYVNTNKIDQTNIAKHAHFGQGPGITNEEYTTHVKKGDIVIWKGVSISDPKDIVNITEIEHKMQDKSKNFFDRNRLRGNGDDHETVVGTLKRAKRGEEQKYILKCTVIDNGNGEPRKVAFEIDPKLKGNT